MDGLLALDLWDIVIEVLTKDNIQPQHWAEFLIPKPRPKHVTRKQKVAN